MKYIKKYEFYWDKHLPEVILEELVPVEKLHSEFDDYGLSCNPTENNMNDIEYAKDNLSIIVTYTSKAFQAEFSKKLSDDLQKICNNIGADDFDFTATFQVTFYFDSDKHPELIEESINESRKECEHCGEEFSVEDVHFTKTHKKRNKTRKVRNEK